MSVFSDIYNKVVKKGSIADEPPVDEQLGVFGDINIPVQQTKTPAYWGMSNADVPYTVAQTQEEHNRLLNTFYPYRGEMPDWKERGVEEEAKAPHFNDEDEVIRKDLGVRSSVVSDIAYNPDTQTAKVKLGNKWYNYNATPEQFKQFISEGSLGKALNRISNNHGSMLKSGNRSTPAMNSVFGGI